MLFKIKGIISDFDFCHLLFLLCLLVHAVCNWLSRNELAHVFCGCAHQARACLDGGPCDVGCQEAIARGEQRIVAAGWLLRQHIGAECRQTLAVERIGDSLLVDKRTAPGVDQNSRWFHLGDGCGIDEMTCRRREWAVKADHVG